MITPYVDYPYRFCHAEFEAAKTRSCDKLGTKSITMILHFFIPDKRAFPGPSGVFCTAKPLKIPMQKWPP
jgi:hypothetical protein